MKAYGTFTKIGNYIYRTDTYLKFGDSDDLIGACVLCNPGSAGLEDKNGMKELIEHKPISGELKIDPAMRQLVEILKDAYGVNLDGIFRIFNLFTLRNAKMKEAIDCISNNKVDVNMIFKDLSDFSELELKDIPVLRAWGVYEKSDLLNKEKVKWVELIDKKSARPIVGKLRNEYHYYHILPQIMKDKIAIKEYLVDQYRAQENNLAKA